MGRYHQRYARFREKSIEDKSDKDDVQIGNRTQGKDSQICENIVFRDVPCGTNSCHDNERIDSSLDEK